MVSAARFGRVCLITGYTSGLREPSPQALTFLDGARDIFGTAGRVWATALRPEPP